MPDPRDHLDLTTRPPAAAHEEDGAQRTPDPARPWLSLWFTCANAYARAYRTPDGTGYHGRCPKCGKTIGFMIGPGGTSRRTFQVSC